MDTWVDEMATRILHSIQWTCQVSWFPCMIHIQQQESYMSFLCKRSLHGRGSGRGKVTETSNVKIKDQRVAEKDHVYHKPVMVKEVISFFAPQENQVYIDMTFGGGGHTLALIKSAPGITVYGLDRDPFAYQIAQKLSPQYRGQLWPLLGKFSEVKVLVSQHDVSMVDGILIDAGCSSLQFDSPERGFSISQDGPLDMRMDADRIPTQPTAADVVNSLDHVTLTKILRTYGEESNAKRIAQAIIDYRTNFSTFSSTSELATVIACCHTHRDAKNNRDKLGRSAHTATKTFQALRIFVNNELNELAVGMAAAWDLLKPGGKLAVLTFHSLEDRVVKRSLLGHHVAERAVSLKQKRVEPIKEVDRQKWEVVQKKVLSADNEEVNRNPRARSAKLRTAIKLQSHLP